MPVGTISSDKVKREQITIPDAGKYAKIGINKINFFKKLIETL